MNLPSQIQAQVEHAKSIIAQHYPTEGADAPTATDQPADTPPAEPTPVAPVAATPPVAQEPAAPAPAAGAGTEDENSASYAQRWRTLQGKYNALLRQHEETTGRLGNLEHLVAQMQVPPAPAAAPAQAPETVVSPEDVDREGTDRIELITRIVRSELAPLAQAAQLLNARLDKLSGVVPVVENIATVQHQTAQQRFYAELRAAVPTWQAVNDDPRFHEWLMETDPLTGIDRQTYLRDAERKLDSARVSSIFKAGMAALGQTVPPQAEDTPAPTPTNTATPAATNARLARQVAPGRATTTPAPQPAAKRTWSRAEIAKFYADRLRGAFRGREAESKAMEADIFSAQADGRVTA